MKFFINYLSMITIDFNKEIDINISIAMETTTNILGSLEGFKKYHGEKVNNLIFELNQKLEKKQFEIAKSYHETGKFQAAIYSVDDFLNRFPETSLLEDISFIQIKAYYELGKNSIEDATYINAVALSDIVLQIERGVR